MGEASERQIGRFPRLLRYPFEFRRDVHGGLRLRHLSLQRFHDTVPPFARRGPSGRFPRGVAPTAALRLPSAPAPLFDPGGTAASGHSGEVPYFLALRCCLPLYRRRRLPRPVRFRGSITRPARSLSTLRGHGCPCAAYGRARLASGWWPTLAGQDLNLLGPIAKFQPVLHGILLAQAWPGAPVARTERSASFARRPRSKGARSRTA